MVLKIFLYLVLDITFNITIQSPPNGIEKFFFIECLT